MPERKTALHVVEMVARHSQVGKHAVHPAYAVIIHPVFYIPEIRQHKREAPVLRNIGRRVAVLVEAEQAAVAVHAPQNLTRVSAAAECDIHIHAALANRKPVHALVEHYGYVINGFGNVHGWLLIISSSCLAKSAAGILCAANCGFDHTSTVSSIPRNTTSWLIPAICA